MGEIVFAAATVHAPQLFTYPPSEDKAQLDADIAAMRELGKNLDEIKPDAVDCHRQRPSGNVFPLRRSHLCDRRRREIESCLRPQDLRAADSRLRRRVGERPGRRRLRPYILAGRRARPRVRRRVRMGHRRPLDSGGPDFRQHLPASAAHRPPLRAVGRCYPRCHSADRHTGSRSSPAAACRIIRARGNIRSPRSISIGGPSRIWSAATTTRCLN